MAEGSSIAAIPDPSDLREIDARDANDVWGLGEARYQMLAEHISDIIVRTDLTGTILYISPACRALGYEPDDLIGRSPAELVHPDDFARFSANASAVFSGRPIDRALDREIRYRRKDGSWAWLEGNPQVTRDETGQPIGLLNVFRDITERKLAQMAAIEAEAERRANAELFENAFHNAAVGKALVDLDGRFQKINPAFCDLVGYPEQRMLELDFQSITHPEDLEADLGLLAQLTAGEIPTYRMDKRYIRADGAVVWVQLAVSMVAEADGRPKHYIAQVQDQTARRNAELALAESEAQFRSLAEKSSDIIVRLGADGLIRYISPACRALGLDPDQEIGQPVMKLVAPEHADHSSAILSGLFSEAGIDPTVRRVHKVIGANGQELWLEGNPRLVRDDSGRVVEVVTVMRDVTARREIELALEQSERRFRTLAENAPDMITECRLDGTWTYVSPASLTITGFAPEELVGQNAFSWMHPDDAPKLLAMCQAVFDSKGAIAPWPVEFRSTHKDGRPLWLECKPTFARDPATGRFTGLNDVIRDITSRKMLEAELRQAQAEAEAAAAVKGEFLANMSHEIRTPLTAILGFSNLLAERQGLDEVGRGHLDRVQTAGRSLLSIVNDVLDFSKLEAGQFEFAPKSLAPADFAHETLLMFAPQAEAKGLTLDFIAEGELPDFVALDPDRVRQILFNLIGNALKFTREGSVRLRLRYETSRSRLHVAIEDSGPGISAADQAKLFQRFAQVDGSSTRQHGGTGLGLAICKGLTEAMGGQIAVRSTPGQGSTFSLYIVASPAEPPPCADEAQAGCASLDGVRVLVVDDNAVNRELARAVLESAGAEVALAEGGEDAVRKAAGAPYDLILLDRRMPGMDGPQTLRRIRSEPGPNDSIPILAFSADVDLGSLLGSGGFDDFVGKPVNAAALIETVSKWTQWDAPAPELEALDADAV